MAEIVNLRQARKRKARAERENEAATNRALSGRSKADKLVERGERERAGRVLEAHRIDDTPKDEA